MVRHDAHEIAGLQRAASATVDRTRDRRVLFRQPLDQQRLVGSTRVQIAATRRRSRRLAEPARQIVRQRLAAAIEDDAVRAPAG